MTPAKFFMILFPSSNVLHNYMFKHKNFPIVYMLPVVETLIYRTLEISENQQHWNGKRTYVHFPASGNICMTNLESSTREKSSTSPSLNPFSTVNSFHPLPRCTLFIPEHVAILILTILECPLAPSRVTRAWNLSPCSFTKAHGNSWNHPSPEYNQYQISQASCIPNDCYSHSFIKPKESLKHHKIQSLIKTENSPENSHARQEFLLNSSRSNSAQVEEEHFLWNWSSVSNVIRRVKSFWS